MQFQAKKPTYRGLPPFGQPFKNLKCFDIIWYSSAYWSSILSNCNLVFFDSDKVYEIWYMLCVSSATFFKDKLDFSL
ncbi:MAG: hypothetical protein A2W90_08695 [Bacteroidetes bacterium GWF2_42_66]|nr:MAG: hypothetical protein A2W92_14735 [Bacteroidetes bacterium GWA2_42_15]OFX96544.1 MAG: hypothetical protein A2W89_06355 [Bacteroidetes bacterium GWE2_42_39]OFY40964.1 MAG: hypothetical protein A2W90_08695 [Bacteroidetes bacterium GWF2_42_66]